MLNKDKRSLILSMVLGDGCLHYIKNAGSVYGGLSIDHGTSQADYVAWKAQIVSSITGRNVKVRQGHKGKSVQFQVCWKRLRAWRKFTYPNGKKEIIKILPFLKHPEFAAAVWLMDDGYVETSGFQMIHGVKTTKSARFRIFTYSESISDYDVLIKWFETQLGVKPKVRFMNDKRTSKTYPFLAFTEKDSLKIWHTIRDTVLGLKSMQHKFRYIEQVYQFRILQRAAGNKPDDIVRHSK